MDGVRTVSPTRTWSPGAAHAVDTAPAIDTAVAPRSNSEGRPTIRDFQINIRLPLGLLPFLQLERHFQRSVGNGGANSTHLRQFGEGSGFTVQPPSGPTRSFSSTRPFSPSTTVTAASPCFAPASPTHACASARKSRDLVSATAIFRN